MLQFIFTHNDEDVQLAVDFPRFGSRLRVVHAGSCLLSRVDDKPQRRPTRDYRVRPHRVLQVDGDRYPVERQSPDEAVDFLFKQLKNRCKNILLASAIKANEN